MVNVIDNTARGRANKMPVGIKIIDDKGGVAHTAKTDLGTNYISLESKWFGSSSNNTGGNTGGSTGGNTGGGNSGNTGGGSSSSQVAQLPSGMSLMSGDSNGIIPLKFVNDNYSNISGLQITFNPKIVGINASNSNQNYYVNFDDVGLPFPRMFKINKSDLVVNKSYLVTSFNDPSTIKTYGSDGTEVNNIYSWNQTNIPNDSLGRTLKLDANSGLIILNKSIDFNVSWTLSDNKGDKAVFKASIIDISTL